MAKIELRNINKIFPGNTQAIDDLSLTIEDGEFVVFVGPSGCGKTTALRLVAGLEEVSSGQILADGKDITSLTPQERNVAMVFQNYALYPHKTVRRNLEFPLKMVKMSPEEKEKRIQEACRLLGLGEYLDRKPKQLSGGQRQRVAMGRAIVRDPLVFLMDEPLSNLDAKLRLEIRTEIAELQNKIGITTLYVTHDQVEAMTLGQRVAVFNGGKLQQIASAQELYESPINTFVATFIGSPSMNLFRGKISKQQDSLAVELGKSSLPLPASIQEKYSKLAEHCDQEVVIGLRPESFSLTAEKDSQLSGKVVTFEALGHEHIVYCDVDLTVITDPQSLATSDDETDINKAMLVARLPSGHFPDKGESLHFKVDVEKLYFFDLEGKAIL